MDRYRQLKEEEEKTNGTARGYHVRRSDKFLDADKLVEDEEYNSEWTDKPVLRHGGKWESAAVTTKIGAFSTFYAPVAPLHS